jgi:hypothetical protein
MGRMQVPSKRRSERFVPHDLKTYMAVMRTVLLALVPAEFEKGAKLPKITCCRQNIYTGESD